MNFMVVIGSLEQGIIYAVMALGVFISFRSLNMPDLTVDGSFVLGAAVSAVMCTIGHPILGLLLAFIVGGASGCITALLHTKLKIQPLLAGILTMLALYSVNLRVMDNRASIPLINETTVFSVFRDSLGTTEFSKMIISVSILLMTLVMLFLFLKTKLGFVVRATGDNKDMVKALGVNTDFTILLGLGLANGLVSLSGALIAQYQTYASVSMGVGMVIIGLASVIIGEVIFGTRSLFRRLIAVILGSILYRFFISLAFELGMPPTDLKLVSAGIVAMALSIPAIKGYMVSMRKRLSATYRKRGGTNECYK